MRHPLGFVVTSQGGAVVDIPDPFGLYSQTDWTASVEPNPAHGESGPSSANQPSPLMTWLRDNKNAVYIGAAAFFLLALMGGRRR